MKRNTLFFWLALICAAFAPFTFWPLGIVGIVLAANAKHWILALMIGFVLDVLYGAPPVNFHALFFPLTMFAVLVIAVRTVAGKYILKRGRGETL